MADQYNVNAVFAKEYPDAVTSVEGVTVLLSGVDREFEIAGTQYEPPTKRRLKVATQKQLQLLYDAGNPHIEKVDKVEKTEKV